jgi:hypothetical protein
MQLSKSTQNPAGRINDNYQELMTIQDPAELRQRAECLLAGGGISSTNAKKFRLTLQRETSLSRMQSFLTNFMLKADGLGVI